MITIEESTAHMVTMVALSSHLPSAETVPVSSTILTAPDPPTVLSAIHDTSTSIHVYWSPPSPPPSTGYDITVQPAEGGASNTVTVDGGTRDNHQITSGIQNDVIYTVSIVAVSSITGQSDMTGPVLAARGEKVRSQFFVIISHAHMQVLV